MDNPLDQNPTEVRGRFFQAFTGRKGDVSGTSGDVSSMLTSLYGTDDKRSKYGIDFKAAAKGMKVSATTLRRWARNDQHPSTANLKKLQAKSRRAATTKRGRAQILKQTTSRLDRSVSQGVRVAVSGIQGPPAQSANLSSDAYLRDRITTIDLNWENYDQLLKAYEEGGENGAQDYILGKMRENGYPDDFQYHTVNGVGFGRMRSPHLDWS